ncbi:hypothetical protein ACFLTT_00155 [Chloroflexota bacterium]
MRKEYGAIFTGVGLEIVFLILSMQVKIMPAVYAISGYIVGGLLILYGIVCMFVPLKKIWEVLMSIRWRSPIFRQLNKKSEETKAKLSTDEGEISRLLKIAERQRDNPVTHLVITDRIWFEFKREAKLPFIWARIFYKNLGVNDLMITLPEGYVFYKSERLPERIIAEEGRQNVPANGGIGQFNLSIYIPIGFRDDVCAEIDDVTKNKEIRNLQLHEISSKVYIKGDDTRCVKWSLGGERAIFRSNG